MKSSLSIPMISSWLNERVSTMLNVVRNLDAALRGSDPRENLLHDVVQCYFAFDVRQGSIAEGLDFKLKLTSVTCARCLFEGCLTKLAKT